MLWPNLSVHQPVCVAMRARARELHKPRECHAQELALKHWALDRYDIEELARIAQLSQLDVVAWGVWGTFGEWGYNARRSPARAFGIG